MSMRYLGPMDTVVKDCKTLRPIAKVTLGVHEHDCVMCHTVHKEKSYYSPEHPPVKGYESRHRPTHWRTPYIVTKEPV